MYGLSDPAKVDALIEVPTIRFAGIDLISERIPDKTTILSFRHFLEKHDLGNQIFKTMKAHLARRQLGRRARCLTVFVTRLIVTFALAPLSC